MQPLGPLIPVDMKRRGDEANMSYTPPYRGSCVDILLGSCLFNYIHPGPVPQTPGSRHSLTDKRVLSEVNMISLA